MPGTKKTWVAIALAALIIVAFMAVAAVGVTALFFYSHVNTRFVPVETASEEFAHARERFAGQRPMIEIAADEVFDADDVPHGRVRAIVHRERVAPGEISNLHVLAYDPRANKLVRADVPRWLLELSSVGGRVRIANLDVLQGDHERVTLDDFDKRGPGLVLSVRRLRGAEVLVWTD